MELGDDSSYLLAYGYWLGLERRSWFGIKFLPSFLLSMRRYHFNLLKAWKEAQTVSLVSYSDGKRWVGAGGAKFNHSHLPPLWWPPHRGQESGYYCIATVFCRFVLPSSSSLIGHHFETVPQMDKTAPIASCLPPMTNKKGSSWGWLVIATCLSWTLWIWPAPWRISFQWTEQCQVAFVQVKKALCEEPLLHTPDFSLPFGFADPRFKLRAGDCLSQQL